jgi:hypothetical protein
MQRSHADHLTRSLTAARVPRGNVRLGSAPYFPRCLLATSWATAAVGWSRP